MKSRQYYGVSCFTRKFMLRPAETPEDIKRVFDNYSDNGTMSTGRLLQFLIEFQGEESATEKEAQVIFDSFKHLHIFHRKVLHLEAFFRYLLSDHNPPLSPSAQVHHDMQAPLAHYFLYTGHNSYITGNQFTSDCSTAPIIRALQRGVRVIELDLWPSKTEKSDVDVRHGGASTAPVKLVKCLRAIKDHAFSASEYPVVITFEDHLGPDLQAKVASMVHETFGETLFHPKSNLNELPSPFSLKKKILISTNPPKELPGSDGKQQNNSQKAESPAEKEPCGDEVKEDVEDEADGGEDHQDEDLQQAGPQYRHLIAIHGGKQKGGIGNWLCDNSDKVKRISLSEEKLENAVKKYATDIIRFTQVYLLRVYPKGTRLLSSNYDPMVGWTHGAQMVAFNMQGYGHHLWKMQGMFRANGGCGYVKKPNFLLDPNTVFDPSKDVPIKTILKVWIPKVKLYMGHGWHSDFHHNHFDLCSPPDFYAKVGIAGVRADEKTMRTTTVTDEWIPEWNESFEFRLRVPELALLWIKVKDDDPAGRNDFAGQTCLPVSELRTGIRAVPLHDRRGKPYKSVKLLMRFEFENIHD
ncbi:phosphoinositide phospholipase C 2-like isoform X2 [Diospyros lotus]|uniref:phosphoinositide phospholipase C 2-like isoform X2 n=1 Tax=Diospyros lotus TaxID=55363 RepID=UPI00224FABDF|nr:phosphoinositide phospholipase C 2-like isoform X2 [Diospyros lotus]